MSHYIGLYSGRSNQGGYGLSDIEVYRGPIHQQQGAGIGNFFSTAVRFLRPLLSSGINVLSDQGIKSASSVLSQLGKKDLKTILNEESQNAIRNLSEKAIEKLKRKAGNVSSQKGSGKMLRKMSPIQHKRMRKTKGIKARGIKRKSQTVKRRKIGLTNSSVKKIRQIGGKRKKSKVKKSQTKRKSKSKVSRKRTSKSGQLDIFS